jgi:CRP-like cAMP-binding protein
LTLAYCGPSEVFGESCLIDDTNAREEMAEAMENAMVTELAREEFDKLLQVHAPLGYQMTKLLAARRRDVENKLETLVFRDGCRFFFIRFLSDKKRGSCPFTLL